MYVGLVETMLHAMRQAAVALVKIANRRLEARYLHLNTNY